MARPTTPRNGLRRVPLARLNLLPRRCRPREVWRSVSLTAYPCLGYVPISARAG